MVRVVTNIYSKYIRKLFTQFYLQVTFKWCHHLPLYVTFPIFILFMFTAHLTEVKQYFQYVMHITQF